jgi:hypothetical protein
LSKFVLRPVSWGLEFCVAASLPLEGGLSFVPDYCGFFQMMLTLVVVTRRAGRANNLLNMLMLA